jgi:hypothetical protein
MKKPPVQQFRENGVVTMELAEIKNVLTNMREKLREYRRSL